MKLRILTLAAVTLAPVLLDACASYGPPPPPSYAGESWHRHLHRCLRAYPHYDPRTDMIERPGGAYRCPL